MTRAMIWRSFFDMVKDSKMTSEKYLEIFTNNIDQEPFDSIFEKQFDLAHAAINSYTPKAYRELMNTNLFYFILWLIKITPDKQANRIVVLKNKLGSFADSQESKRILVDWWAERFEPLKSHKMTIGQQWTAVVKAFTLKDWTLEQKEEVFTKQSQVDSSDTMKSKRISCDSLKSTDEEADKLYASFIDKEDKQSASLRRAAMSHFNSWHHHDRMNQKYYDRYFADVQKMVE